MVEVKPNTTVEGVTNINSNSAASTLVFTVVSKDRKDGTETAESGTEEFSQVSVTAMIPIDFEDDTNRRRSEILLRRLRALVSRR